MRAAVCDDVLPVMELLYSAVSSEFKKQDIPMQTFAFSGGLELLEDIKKEPYDVLFLDVCIPDISGYQIAKEVRSQSDKTFIVFVTEREELVYDCFDYRPFDFIRKDSPEGMRKSIAKVISRMRGYLCPKECTLFYKDYMDAPVKSGDIMYIKSDRHYINCHLNDGRVIKIRDSLKNIEEQFCKCDFARVHQRCIVNLKYVNNMDWNKEVAMLKNGQRLDVSRSHKNEAREQFIDYMMKNM